MQKCRKCKEKFPSDLVQPMCVNGKYIDVCGVCALETVREAHGIPDYTFTEGGMAEDLYMRTKTYKEKRGG